MSLEWKVDLYLAETPHGVYQVERVAKGWDAYLFSSPPKDVKIIWSSEGFRGAIAAMEACKNHAAAFAREQEIKEGESHE